MTMDNLSHITPTVIETALAALVRGRDRIIGEYAGYGCESTIYEIDAAIAALKGEEYVRVPVGGDVVIPNRPVGEQELVALARLAFEARGLEWDGEPSFGLHGGSIYVLACQDRGEDVGDLEDAIFLCDCKDMFNSLVEQIFMAGCRNEHFGLMER